MYLAKGKGGKLDYIRLPAPEVLLRLLTTYFATQPVFPEPDSFT